MTREPRIVDARPAGPDHQVLSVEGGRRTYRRRPCGGCPWRVDQTGEFPAEAFRQSAGTAYDLSTRMFGCHEAGAAQPATCAGFLMAGSEHNLAYRLAVSQGRIDPGQVSDGGHALHVSYRAMAEANGVHPDDPALAPCRDPHPAD